MVGSISIQLEGVWSIGNWMSTDMEKDHNIKMYSYSILFSSYKYGKLITIYAV